MAIKLLVTWGIALGLLVMSMLLPKIRITKGKEFIIDYGKLKVALISTCVFMFLAYTFAYTNGIFLFDASFIYRGINLTPDSVSDKWLSPYLSVLDMGVNLPWLGGIFTVLFMVISVYLIVDMLNITNKVGIWAVAGLCSTNSSIICQQEYTGGSYTGEIALFFACLAAWYAIKGKASFKSMILTIVFVALSAGTYGSYVSVTPCLMIISVIIDIFDGKYQKKNWTKICSCFFEFLLGIFLYYVILRAEMHFMKAGLQSYMGEDALANASGILAMFKWIPRAYENIVDYYVGGSAGGFLPAYMAYIMMVVFGMGGFIFIIYFIINFKKINSEKGNTILLLLLLIVFPLAINLIYVMSSGNVHFMMIFSYVMPFILMVKIAEELKENFNNGHWNYKGIYKAFYSGVAIFIFCGIVLSNAIFSRYYGMYVEAQSIGTRVLDRIENCENFTGTERIVIIGAMQNDTYYGSTDENRAEVFDALIGCANYRNINGVNYGSWLRRFITNILGSNMDYTSYTTFTKCIESENLDSQEVEILENMNYFPRYESVQKIGDIIFIKFPDDI